MATSESSTLFFVGSYTQVEGHVPDGCGEGITSFLLDNNTGQIKKLMSTTKDSITNPTYLYYNEKEQQLYAVEEITGGGFGNLIIYDVNKSNGKLAEVTRLSTEGLSSCHISMLENDVDNSNSKLIFVSNYSSGSVCIFEFNNNKKEGSSSLKKHSLISYTGSGPNKNRQEASHCHIVTISPDKKFMYVCDLGCDKIWCHTIPSTSNDTGSVEKNITIDEGSKREQLHGYTIVTPLGSGPRQLIFHPIHKDICYCICELSGMLHVYTYDGKYGKLTEVDCINTLPNDYCSTLKDDEDKSSACILVHSSGKALYASNRLHDSIAIITLDESDGKPLKTKKKMKTSDGGEEDDTADSLTHEIKWISSGGEIPRDFSLSIPSNDWLVIGNQDGKSNITTYKIDANDPANIDEKTKQTFDCKTPACITFAK